MRATAHVFVFALLAAGLASAWAQQPPAANPELAASAPKAAPAPPIINRWVDAHGRVHYGDALPANVPERTTAVGPLQSATPEQKAQGQAQLQQYRDYLNQPADAPPQTALSEPAAQEQARPDNSCAAQWARFNAAAACASPYHVKGGGLRGEVAQHCPVVPQPQCPPPGP